MQPEKIALAVQETDNSDKIKLLSTAIKSFNGAALKFERYYQHIEKRVNKLRVELKGKNEELEKSLREKEGVKRYLHDILESVTTGVLVIDLNGIITTFNRAAESITGLTSEEVKGKDFTETFGPNFFNDSHLDLSTLMDVKKNTEFETEILRKGKNVLHVSFSSSPLKNGHGKKIGIVLTLQDITRMKKLEERANRTDRLAAMGEMAVKIAHEIRNPLGSIELFASILKKDLEDFGELKTLAEHVSSGVKSINNIISNLLLFIRPEQRPDFKPIDIHDFLDDSLFFSSHLVNSNGGIDVTTCFSSETLMILGDTELLKQACLNVILNCIQAMPNGGKLTISARKTKGENRNEDLVEIRFDDTGIGISRDDKHKIFDPFFTTKKRGTGLGLPIVHNIVKLHGGSVDINSTEGGGTVCIFTLPLMNRKTQQDGVEAGC